MSREPETARRALGALLLSITVTLSAAWAGPMDLGGQFNVSVSGAATYSIPIQVPPGTGGIEPKLALSYNSQTGNGLLGMGWSLSGLSAVTRCPRTIAQDGAKSGINFDANDRFCLDGQRLVAISGSYGANGTAYRTERESFSKVISYGSAGTGPAWFKVWTKAGQIIEYGNTTDSRIEAQGKTSARVWAINKISDTKGNYLTVSYTEDGTNGDYIPSRIDYTGNATASLSPNNSVRFVYEARPDSVPGYFAGSLVKSIQRLTTLQTYSGATLVKEYRLAYATSPSSNRSRLTALTECALPDNSCKPPLSLAWSDFGANSFGSGSSWTTLVTSWLADVDGDGRADMVAQQSDGLYVALSTGTSVGASGKWVSSFGSSQGYSDQNLTPIFLIDVNSDGLADAVGFASDGVYVALSNGSGFGTATKWIDDFGTGTGWTNMDTRPRTFADVDGDGQPDIVGFKDDGVYAALNTGAAFGPTVNRWSYDFGSGSTVAFATNAANPRFTQDMNGDGLPDLAGFANGGLYVGLNTGTGFAASTLWLTDFGVTAGWTTQDTYPRTLADVNGDGLADIVGFKNDGVYVAINTGTGLQTASKWLSDFGTATTTAYSTQKGFPRYVLDINGDAKADIVGFAANGVQVSLGTGTGFGASGQWVAGFGSAAGYTIGMPRQVADLDGDGFPDVIGTLASGTSVALSSRSVPPDWVTAFASGLGPTTTLSYDALTKPGVHVKDNGAVYPQMDLAAPLYVVSLVRSPNALGSGYTLNYYQYGGFRVDLSGRGALGFGWQQMLQTDSNLSVRTGFRQDWPYQGLPAEITKTLRGAGNGDLLSLVVNSYACINPQTGAACTVAAGNRYFPYVSQTTEAGWDVNRAALPVMATNYKYLDGYGNATEIKVTTDDGFTKTTTNTYTNNTTSWLLGRLTSSVVVSSATGTPVSNMSNGEFDFTRTITTNTENYNLRAAAAGAGWDQSTPLKATVTINAGVTVSSTALTTSAFDTGGNFPPGSTLSLVNNGNIYGAGGSGGGGGKGGIASGSASTAGASGGAALNAMYRLTVTNNGTIAGGGGGGGGGGGVFVNSGGSGGTAGSGGGGGAGANTAAGGGAGTMSGNGWNIDGLVGSAGTSTAGGAGGASNSYAGYTGGAGGAGGGYGQAGATGTQGSVPGYNPPYAGYTTSPQAGGASGSAVTNNANITWLVTGTRLGPVVAGSADAPLTLTSITPNVGAVVGDTVVVLTGTGFGPGATVSIGGVAAVGCSANSSTMITCLTPINSVGTKNVVVNFAGDNATLANGFTYQTLGITSVSPAIGSFAGGTAVTLTGTGFAPGTWANIGGAAAAACVVNSSTSMTCLTGPNSAGIKNVVVGLDETSATLANAFTYQGLGLTAVSPNQVGPGGGVLIALTGTGFAPGAAVTIGGMGATGCVVTGLTSMTCIAPATNSLGAKDVVLSLGGSTSTLAGGMNVSAFVFSPTVSGTTTNYDLRSAAITAGWDQMAPLAATVTIAPGAYVTSSSTSNPAFTTGTGFPTGSTLALINKGTIAGKGGAGGTGGGTTSTAASPGLPGSAGGPALQAAHAIAITNNGTIGGGGGGGGGGGSIVTGFAVFGGGGGGGGRGGGTGGAFGDAVTYSSGGVVVNYVLQGAAGTAGGPSTSGTGGSGGRTPSVPSQYGGNGGNGGALGVPGGSGASGLATTITSPIPCALATPCYLISPMTPTNSAGGSAGVAVIGNSNVTWVATGTRLGALQ